MGKMGKVDAYKLQEKIQKLEKEKLVRSKTVEE
jgi:hypothetical protein